MLTDAQVVALEKANTEKDAHGEFESEHPGYCGAAPRRKCLRHNSVQRRMPRGNQGEPLSSRLSRDSLHYLGGDGPYKGIATGDCVRSS